MATVTSQASTQNRHTTPYHADAYVIDIVAEGYHTASTHPAIDVPEGWALVGGSVIVEDSVTGGTSLRFVMSGGDELTGVLPIADLAAGDVIDLRFGDAAAVEGVAGYAKSAALTIDIITVGTMDGGKIVIVPELIRIDSAILNP